MTIIVVKGRMYGITTMTQDLNAAKAWFSSLPAGRKSYFKEHYRLNRDDKLVRFWINNIKEVNSSGSH